jgi:hypothetical protein
MCYAGKGETALRGHKSLIDWKLSERPVDVARARHVAN